MSSVKQSTWPQEPQQFREKAVQTRVERFREDVGLELKAPPKNEQAELQG